MKYDNLISTSISSEDLNEILKAIEFINDKLPDLVSLSEEELASLPKMRHNTIEFVCECLNYAEKNPEIVPDNVDIPEIKKDVELIKQILDILDPLMDLVKKLEDSALLAGSEAYLPSMAIYNATQANKIRKRNLKKAEKA